MAAEVYRVAPGPLLVPSRVATSKRYPRLEDALAEMGGGVVVAPGGRIAAFHEGHLDMMLRLASVRTTKES